MFPAEPVQIPIDIRKSTFQQLLASVNADAKTFSEELLNANYEISEGNDLSIFSNYDEQKLTDSIVRKSKKEHTEAIEDLFSIQQNEIKKNPFLATFSFITAFTQETQPRYSYDAHIDFARDKVICYSYKLKAKSIYDVSCGLAIMIYQAVYGVGLACSSYYKDYNGFSDSKFEGPFTEISAYKVNKDLSANIQKEIQSQIKFFKTRMEDWNKERKAEIKAFSNKAK